MKWNGWQGREYLTNYFSDKMHKRWLGPSPTGESRLQANTPSFSPV